MSDGSRKRKREDDPPRITFHAQNRTFDRLFREESLSGLKDVVRRKLGLRSVNCIHLVQLRDGQRIDLDDDDDFAAFCSVAFSKPAIDVLITVTEETDEVSPSDNANALSHEQAVGPLPIVNQLPPNGTAPTSAGRVNTPSTGDTDGEPKKKKRKKQQDNAAPPTEKHKTPAEGNDTDTGIVFPDLNNDSIIERIPPSELAPATPVSEPTQPPKKQSHKKKLPQETNTTTTKTAPASGVAAMTEGNEPSSKPSTKTKGPAKSRAKARAATAEPSIPVRKDTPSVISAVLAPSDRMLEVEGSIPNVDKVTTKKRTKKLKKDDEPSEPSTSNQQDASTPQPDASPQAEQPPKRSRRNSVASNAKPPQKDLFSDPEAVAAVRAAIIQIRERHEAAKREGKPAAGAPPHKPLCVICGVQAHHPPKICPITRKGTLSAIEQRLAQLEKISGQNKATDEAIRALKESLKNKRATAAPLPMSSATNNKSMQSKSDGDVSASSSDSESNLLLASPVIARVQAKPKADTNLAALNLDDIVRGPVGAHISVRDLISEESSEEKTLALEEEEEQPKSRRKHVRKPVRRPELTTDEEDDSRATEIPQNPQLHPQSGGLSHSKTDLTSHAADGHEESIEVGKSTDVAGHVLEANKAILSLPAKPKHPPPSSGSTSEESDQGHPPSSARQPALQGPSTEKSLRGSQEANLNNDVPSLKVQAIASQRQKKANIRVSELPPPPFPASSVAPKSQGRSAKTPLRTVNLKRPPQQKNQNSDSGSDDSVSTWTVLKEPSPDTSMMIDELRSPSPVINASQKSTSKKSNAQSTPGGASKSGDPLFILSQSQAPFPYSQWGNNLNAGKRPTLTTNNKDDEESDENEEPQSISAPPKNRSAPQFRRLTDIASQQSLFEAPQLRPATFTREDRIRDLYGQNANNASIADSSSDSDSDDAQPSHIPKSRRAGQMR